MDLGPRASGAEAGSGAAAPNELLSLLLTQRDEAAEGAEGGPGLETATNGESVTTPGGDTQGATDDEEGEVRAVLCCVRAVLRMPTALTPCPATPCRRRCWSRRWRRRCLVFCATRWKSPTCR